MPYTIAGTERFSVRSARGGAYEIMIARPTGEPPSPAGYPVLYVLDANAVFGTVAESVGLRSRRPEASGIVPSVVVGIGYPVDGPFDLERRSYDYTPPASVENLPPRPDGAPWPPVGGADEFLDFIVEEVRPMIGRLFPIDVRRQSLFGHSFGGLFALHTLFNRPELFHRIVAASPSIWWYRHALRDDEAAFIRRAKSGGLRADVLITAGDQEQRLIPAEAAQPHAEVRAQWKERNRMVDNANELAGRLSALSGHGVSATFTVFEGEDHTSVIPAALARAITFALTHEP